MSDEAEIAGRLGKGQRQVLLSLRVNQWATVSDERTARQMFWGIRGGHFLVKHKHVTGSEDRACWGLTPLGLAVRAHLLGHPNAE